jgi:hypothetical protein
MERPPLEEGWYLMSTRDLELELARLRGESVPGSKAQKLTTEAAISYRNAGNLPDENDRTLRLVLDVTGDIDSRRLEFEPDFHAPPDWRRQGSKPVNVIPLGVRSDRSLEAWWDDPAVAALDEEWERSGTIAGLRVPSEFRSFIYKTVIALQKAGKPITTESVVGSIARWLDEPGTAAIRSALDAANAKEAGPPQDRPPPV